MTREEVLQMLWERPVELGHWVGLDKLEDLHNEWLRAFLYNQDDQTLQAHRGSYKTTTLSLFFAIHPLIKPNETIIYFRKSAANVVEITKQAAKIMDSGAYHKLVQTIYGRDFTFLKNTANEIDTDLKTSISGASQLVGYGINTSITGKHADIIVTDDIVTLADRVSRAERETTKLSYMELQNIKNRDGRILNTGTPWHKEDCFTLMPDAVKYDCYNTGLIDRQQLQKIRSSMSPTLFAANYELKHIADENAMFGEPHFEDDPTKIYGGRAQIDASYGGEDFTAYTIMNKHSDGTITACGKMWKKHVDDCLNEIEAIHQSKQAGSIICETNGDKGYLGKELTKRDFEVKTYAERQNKYIKISTYLRKYWDKIRWTDDTDPEYLAQVLDYTEDAAHDDAPDSAASLLRDMETKATLNMGSYLKGGI